MEDALIAALKTCLELLIGAICWFPWDLLLLFRERRRSDALAPPGNGTLYAGAPFAGATFAGLSLLVIPHTVLHSSALRLANLAVTPLVCALSALAFARRRKRRGEPSDQRLHFWFTLLFLLGFVVVRFVWAARAAR